MSSIVAPSLTLFPFVPLHTVAPALPPGSQVERGGSRRLGIAWHPDGGVQLAVPGTDKDVVLLERLNWRPMGYLAGGHEEAVDLVTWSPNGG